jgi:hypothetical protein
MQPHVDRCALRRGCCRCGPPARSGDGRVGAPLSAEVEENRVHRALFCPLCLVQQVLLSLLLWAAFVARLFFYSWLQLIGYRAVHARGCYSNQIAVLGSVIELCTFLPAGFGALPVSMHTDLAVAMSDTDPRVCSAVLPVFHCAAATSSLQGLPESLLSPRAVTRMVAILRRFCEVGGIATDALTILTVFAGACRTHGEMLHKFGAIAAVAEALRAFSGAPHGSNNKMVVQGSMRMIVMATCSIGKRLAGDDDLSRALLQGTIAAGWEHMTDATVASVVAGTLWSVAHVRYRTVLSAPRAIPLLIEMMRVHATVAQVQEYGIVALRNCLHSWQGPGCDMPVAYADGAKQVLRQEGALSVIIRAFQQGLAAAAEASWGAPGTPEHLLSVAVQVIACLGRNASDADAAQAISSLCTMIIRFAAREAASNL